MEFDGTIRWEPALYDAPGEAWLAAMRALPAAADSALVVAHSPGIAEAAALLTGAPAARVRRADRRTHRLTQAPSRAGSDLDEGGASLRWFLRPKLVEKL